MTEDKKIESDFIMSIIRIPESSEYYSVKDYISATALKSIKQSPLHYKESEKKEATEAMIFGSAYHTFILEPAKFEERYFVMDDTPIYDVLIGEGFKSPRGTKQYKEWVENQMHLAEGKVIIDDIMNRTLVGMRDRLLSNRFCASLLRNGKAEESIFCEIKTPQDKNIKIKLRPDYVKYEKNVIIDLKTTISASKEEFPKGAANFDYHIQAALYTDILNALTGKQFSFFFIAQEKIKPFAFNIFECSPQFISQGRYEWELLAMLWQECMESGKWPGYQVWCENNFGINELKLPAWAIHDVNYYIH